MRSWLVMALSSRNAPGRRTRRVSARSRRGAADPQKFGAAEPNALAQRIAALQKPRQAPRQAVNGADLRGEARVGNLRNQRPPSSTRAAVYSASSTMASRNCGGERGATSISTVAP